MSGQTHGVKKLRAQHIGRYTIIKYIARGHLWRLYHLEFEPPSSRQPCKAVQVYKLAMCKFKSPRSCKNRSARRRKSSQNKHSKFQTAFVRRHRPTCTIERRRVALLRGAAQQNADKSKGVAGKAHKRD